MDTRRATKPEPPAWLVAIRRAKAAAWEALAPDDQARALAAIRAWREQKKESRKERDQSRREIMKRVLDLYLDGHSVDEIGHALGLTGERVRLLACECGFLVSRGASELRDPARATLTRAVVIDRLQESALKRLAADSDQPPGAALAELVAIALESDARIARNLLSISDR
jgi:hypothetical protein